MSWQEKRFERDRKERSLNKNKWKKPIKKVKRADPDDYTQTLPIPRKYDY
jgi:hypothetical protein